MRKLVLILFIYCYCLHLVKCYFVELSNDGPVVSGATINFEAKLFDNYRQKITSDSSFSFHWRDDAIPPHTGVTKGSDISHWSTSYKKPGRYEVEVTVHVWPVIFDYPITSARQFFNVTLMLNGDMTIIQDNTTIELSTPYASSAAPVTHEVTLSKPDADYLKTNATSVLSYWFVDCVYYGISDDLRFDMNYTGQAGTDKHIETIVIASYVEPTPPPPTTTTSTTTPSPPPTSSTTTTTSKPPITTQTPPNSTDPSSNITNLVPIPINLQTNEVSETAPTPTNFTTLPINNNTNNNSSDVSPPQFVPDLLKNVTLIIGKNYSNSPDLPYICVNSSTIPPSGKETYGYFKRKIGIRDPVQNVSFTGTNWLKQGDMLNLGVSCNGSAPFFKCVKMYPGEYNITGNETCDNTRVLMDCKFAIIHYFKTAKTYKLAIIISNEVSKIVTPVAVNIYEVTKHPQLSVIIVPVAFSTIAVILIVFGIAYYIQSRNKYTVEVADFDFAQTSDMEYKTFSERLKDAMSNAINRTQDYVEEGNVWSPSRKYGSMQ